MKQRSLEAVMAISLGLALAGCAAQMGGVRGPAPLPEPGTRRAPVPAPQSPPIEVLAAADDPDDAAEPAGDPYALAAPADPALVAAVAASRASYAAAQQAWRQGDIERARELFDQALDPLAVEDLQGEVEVPTLVQALTVQVAAYESAWAARQALAAEEGDEGDEEEPAPIDAIASVDLPEIATRPETVVKPGTSRLAGDMPLEVNNQVRYMLDIYKGRLKDEVTPGFVRSGRFLPMIQDVFRQEGVPQDLAWLALVESGFKPHAYSRAAAKGLWQFIRSTGRLYGLRSDDWVDERSDPVKATRAAARHLKDLHARYGDWYLALAAYNAGAGKVDRAIQRVGKQDYWAIAATRHLRAETKNYVPAFLATLLIVQDPAEHGFDFTPELPWLYDEVALAERADLAVIATCAGTSLEEIRGLNPELRRSATPPLAGVYPLRIPIGTRDRFEAAFAALAPDQRLRHATYTIRRGESLASVARRFGVRLEDVHEANRIPRGGAVKAGSVLKVPLTEVYDRTLLSSSRGGSGGGGTYHRVRKGETLSSIAPRYRVSVSDLRRWNGLSASGRITVGARLRVRPAEAHRPRSTSSGARPTTHRVRRGETLIAIAGRYGVSVTDLARWNRFRASAALQEGQRIQVFTGAR